MLTIFTTKTNQTLSLAVYVNGIRRRVKFTPASVFGHSSASTFCTGDKDLIKALKESPRFGTFFFVKEEYNDEPEVTIVKVKSAEEELKDPSTAVYDETVTTKGMAVAYIQGNYDDVFTATTVEEMKREAARKWNVIFKNWGK